MTRDDWESVMLGEVCDVVGGATPRTSQPANWDGDVLWATPKDLSGRRELFINRTARLISQKGLKESGARLLPPESVLLSSRAPIGLVAINTIPMATNQGFKSLVPDRSCLDPEYLARWLRAKTTSLRALGSGATFKGISKATVEKIALPLPPLAEQRRIVGILSAAQGLDDRRQQAIGLVDHLRRIVFERWLDGLAVQSLCALGTVTERVTKGTTPTSVGLKYAANGIPFLRVKDLHGGAVKIGPDTLFISPDADAQLARSRVLPGDVLMSIAGTIGTVALVAGESAPMNCNQAVAIVRPQSAVRPTYLRAALASRQVQRQIRRVTVTGTISNLSLSEIRALKVPVPPSDRQAEYEQIDQRCQQLIARSDTQSGLLGALSSVLEHSAFNGAL
jgi:type I restriction enzyme, S subunit